MFAHSGIDLKEIPVEVGKLELFILCKLSEKLTLLAAWAKDPGGDEPRYIGQVCKYIEQYTHLLSGAKTLIMGDWNSNKIWDFKHKKYHADAIRNLKSIGLTSLYRI